MREYCECIDIVLTKRTISCLPNPVDILAKYSLTIENMLTRVKEKLYQSSINLSTSIDAGISPPYNKEVTADFLDVGYRDFNTTKWYKCNQGRLFAYYSDVIQHCSLIEAPYRKQYLKLWTIYSPDHYKTEVIDKGLICHGIETYRHKNWRLGKRDPDFTTVNSFTQIQKQDSTCWGEIIYTGRTHKINGNEYFEIDIIIRNADRQIKLGNPFIELINEVIWDAENILRENHGLPKIGEGWISETMLYKLIKNNFPDAIHHASPDWIKPQHLDIFIPSLKIAVEYQGKQHSEPVTYFGGEKAFTKTIERDTRKKGKCKTHGINLINWNYDMPISSDNIEVIISKSKSH